MVTDSGRRIAVFGSRSPDRYAEANRLLARSDIDILQVLTACDGTEHFITVYYKFRLRLPVPTCECGHGESNHWKPGLTNETINCLVATCTCKSYRQAPIDADVCQCGDPRSEHEHADKNGVTTLGFCKVTDCLCGDYLPAGKQLGK